MQLLERWTPARDLERMRRLAAEAGLFTIEPATDIYETADEYVVELEVPGFDEKELDVEVVDHTLLVKGAPESASEQSDKTVLLSERLERRFMRRFELPPIGDTEHVTADFAKGILTLRVPKIEEAKAHKVTIERR